ncbi:ORF6N domain-containing protein [Halalkalibacterium ligniniphilum]|uniref:ORF6N domain-containing protein n=1 Tax=Halalkalibacterium ligniniphilum TaxID=1134413 RepID=UPI000344D774|nr:ORF6N domain-containing protein [Halalkalibacterium ligniniphilum]
MNELKIIEISGQRVLTTNQLAESYGTDNRRISENFSSNKHRYKQDKHYILLEGEGLRDFKNKYGNSVVAQTANKLYLWTEKGAWLHAKSLNTDEAWEAYEMLVDDYYRQKQTVIDTSQLSPELQMFKHLFDSLAKTQLEQQETRKELQEVKTAVTTIKDTFLQRDDDWRKSVTRLLNKAANERNGQFREIRSESYQILEERGRCNLNIRLANMKERLEERGASKTRINQTNKLDVIEADARLKEIYTTIVKELSIGSLV